MIYIYIYIRIHIEVKPVAVIFMVIDIPSYCISHRFSKIVQKNLPGVRILYHRNRIVVVPLDHRYTQFLSSHLSPTF